MKGHIGGKEETSGKGAVKRSGEKLGKPEKQIGSVGMSATQEAVMESIQARNLVHRRAGNCP